MRIQKFFSIIFLAGLNYLFFRTGEEFWLLSRTFPTLKWELAFYVVIFGAALFDLLAATFLFKPEILKQKLGKILQVRNKLGMGRWLLYLFFIFVCVLSLQYTEYGEIVTGTATRYSLGLILVVFGGFLLSKEQEMFAFSSLLQSALVLSLVMAAAVDFVNVSSYPFSLGWSEGNRLWDYSALFGRRLYDYPQGQGVFAYIDFGRQLVGGVPFIFNEVSIWMARAWWALTNTLLYALLGWVLFRRVGEKGKLLMLLGLWTYLFLNQGPIHPPLVVCAILVSIAWGKSYWISVPLLVLSGYFAQMSRFTWIFAPAMWILMLEFSENTVTEKPGKTWGRSVLLALAGLTGSLILPVVIKFTASLDSAASSVSVVADSKASVIGNAFTQGLLWYRLLPSATFRQGVIPALLIATVPVLIVLVYLVVTRRWQMHVWQKIAVSGVLSAFLVVGLIASTKIGGGGDLHNLDMLLIGIVFITAVAWRNGGKEWLISISSSSEWMQVVLVVLVVLPGWRYMLDMRPLELPATKEQVEEAIGLIREQVRVATEDGQVLFMDQRQLLTFGYVEAPLIVDYEKKYLMDQALSGNVTVFHNYYQDLAERNFKLIITEPLHTNLRGSDFIFGEENDAWVTWVSTPTLCFYEELAVPKFVRNSIGVILLVPKEDTKDCSVFLQSVNEE